jgi:hypothetical protein
MKPILDEISNASGYDGSMCYADGEWIGDELARRVSGV